MNSNAFCGIAISETQFCLGKSSFFFWAWQTSKIMTGQRFSLLGSEPGDMPHSAARGVMQYVTNVRQVVTACSLRRPRDRGQRALFPAWSLQQSRETSQTLAEFSLLLYLQILVSAGQRLSK